MLNGSLRNCEDCAVLTTRTDVEIAAHLCIYCALARLFTGRCGHGAGGAKVERPCSQFEGTDPCAMPKSCARGEAQDGGLRRASAAPAAYPCLHTQQLKGHSESALA